jgi:hypothetical protein
MTSAKLAMAQDPLLGRGPQEGAHFCLTPRSVGCAAARDASHNKSDSTAQVKRGRCGQALAYVYG